MRLYLSFQCPIRDGANVVPMGLKITDKRQILRITPCLCPTFSEEKEQKWWSAGDGRRMWFVEEEGGRAGMGRRTAASFVGLLPKRTKHNPLTGTGTGGKNKK